MRIRPLVASAAAVAGIVFATTVFASVTPSLSFGSVSTDSAQLSITGDPNSSVTLFYNIGSSGGALTSALGTTDATGFLSKTISASSLGLNKSNSMYVIIGSSQSTMKYWPTTGSQSSATVSFSQNPVTFSQNQSFTVTISGGTGTYSVQSNSNASVISASINGNVLTLYGTTSGVANIAVCDSANVCATLVANLGSGSANGPVTFNPTNLTVAVGQSQSVTIAGGTSFYVSANSNPGLFTHTLNGSVLTVTGSATGSANLTVCSVSGGCGVLTVTVGGTSSSGGSTAVIFNTSNPSLTVGQSLNVIISGAASYFVSVNSDSTVLQTSINANILNLFGLKAGSSVLTVCATSGGCSQLTVNVSGSAAPVTTTPAPTTTTTTTPVNTAASLLTTIQTMQTQLAQMLAAIQAMQAQLAALVGTAAPVVASTPAATASPVFNGTFVSMLSLNSTGPEVTALQQKLIKGGYLSGSATGFFGPATQAALKKFQSANGIDPAGYTGPSTRAALNAQ